jgi:hypothetical protein
MTQTMAYRRRMLFVTGVMLAVLLLAPRAVTHAASTQNPGVLPPNSHPHGLTYAQWGARWWQWAFSIPVPGNPLIDQTGAYCGAGQSGSVWFLAGAWNGSTPLTRTCTVPPGKALFFPIVNTECDTTPPIPLPPDQWLAICPGLVAAGYPAPNVTTEVDGRQLQHLEDVCPQAQGSHFTTTAPSYCVASGPFDITLPASNLWTAIGVPPFPPGTYQAVQEGVYLLVAPLPSGSHTLRWTGGGGQDITYHLTVLS